MKRENIKGDTSDPSETQRELASSQTFFLLTMTLWRLSERYETNHFSAEPCEW